MAAEIRPKDLPAVTAPTALDKLILDGATARSITFENLFLKAPPTRIIGTDALGGGVRYYRANGTDYTEAYKGSVGLGTTADPLNFYSSSIAGIATSLGRDGLIVTAGGVLSLHATQGVGYGTGAGGAVTQLTSRTTGVTLNKACGAITLFTANGSPTAASFTVTNSAVAATDCVVVSVKSSTTNKYNAFVSAVAAGSFEITFNTTGGTTSDAPVFNFAVIKAVAA